MRPLWLLRLAEQVRLFGGPVREVPVRAHLRQTPHGPAPVAAHVREVEAAAPDPDAAPLLRWRPAPPPPPVVVEAPPLPAAPEPEPVVEAPAAPRRRGKAAAAPAWAPEQTENQRRLAALLPSLGLEPVKLHQRDPDALVTDEGERTKAAAKARARGLALTGQADAVLDHVATALNNTYRRQTQAANTTARSMADRDEGEHLLAAAAAVEAGRPLTEFDRAMMTDPAARSMARQLAQAVEQGHQVGGFVALPDFLDPRLRADHEVWTALLSLPAAKVTPSDIWQYMLDHGLEKGNVRAYYNDDLSNGAAWAARGLMQVRERLSGKIHTDQDRARWRACAELLTPHEHGNPTVYAYGDPGEAALHQWALAQSDKDWRGPFDRPEIMAKVGLFRAADVPGVASRYQLWLDQTRGQGRAPASAVPDRSRAREGTPEQRIEAARAAERRRFVPYQLGNIPGFFETPADVAQEMVEAAELRPGDTVLEPSAGRGGIADRLPGDVEIAVAEINPDLRQQLVAKGYGKVYADEAEVTVPAGGFDKIIMNPPFEGRLPVDQTLSAWERLKPGGRLVVLLPSSWQSGARFQPIQELYYKHGVRSFNQRERAFQRSGTTVSTEVLVLDRPR